MIRSGGRPALVGGLLAAALALAPARAEPVREAIVTVQLGNAVDNQFQLPVLFYVACLIAIGFGATLLEVLLAAAFVVTRYVHAFIHVTSNNVVRRFAASTAGLVLLCLFWLDLLVRALVLAFGAT